MRFSMTVAVDGEQGSRIVEVLLLLLGPVLAFIVGLNHQEAVAEVVHVREVVVLVGDVMRVHNGPICSQKTPQIRQFRCRGRVSCNDMSSDKRWRFSLHVPTKLTPRPFSESDKLIGEFAKQSPGSLRNRDVNHSARHRRLVQPIFKRHSWKWRRLT